MTARLRSLGVLRPSVLALGLGILIVSAVPAGAATPGTATPGTAAPGVVAPPTAAMAVAPSTASGSRARYGPFTSAGLPTATPTDTAMQSTLPTITTTAQPGTAAARAIEFAMAQRGLPYVWGGDGPRNGESGFDCSGLTTAAYAYAGITLPRTAHTQFYAGPHVPDGAPLEPGDLVFYGVPQRVHHVGLYLGDGRMINAPTFGQPVQLAYVRYPGDDYLGATRPAAGQDAPGLLTSQQLRVPPPPLPAPDAPQGPAEFAAPAAPDLLPGTTPGPATAGQLAGAPQLPSTPATTAPPSLVEGTGDVPTTSMPPTTISPTATTLPRTTLPPITLPPITLPPITPTPSPTPSTLPPTPNPTAAPTATPTATPAPAPTGSTPATTAAPSPSPTTTTTTPPSSSPTTTTTAP